MTYLQDEHSYRRADFHRSSIRLRSDGRVLVLNNPPALGDQALALTLQLLWHTVLCLFFWCP